MTAASTIAALRLLWELRAGGGRVWVDAGQVRYEIPRACRSAEVLARLREAKTPLLGLLGAPCPCAPCARGEEPHGPRCYCPACLDADPKWEAWRAEIAEEDRREAEERTAIQREDVS